jgi:hypothetical protein
MNLTQITAGYLQIEYQQENLMALLLLLLMEKYTEDTMQRNERKPQSERYHVKSQMLLLDIIHIG